MLPGEAQHLGRAVPKRVQEFAAGRFCARRALAELGFVGYPLGMNSDRRPRWPADVVGSITHTDGICGAVVAERGRFRAIGLDMEIVGRVTPEIWRTICTPEETTWLSALREPEQSRCAALIFSGKETFYKCQYGVTRQWLEFDDVALDTSLPGRERGTVCRAPSQENRIAADTTRSPDGALRVSRELGRHRHGTRGALTRICTGQELAVRREIANKPYFR